MEMHRTKFITAINRKRNTRKKINLSCDVLLCENKLKNILLCRYAIKKYHVRF